MSRCLRANSRRIHQFVLTTRSIKSAVPGGDASGVCGAGSRSGAARRARAVQRRRYSWVQKREITADVCRKLLSSTALGWHRLEGARLRRGEGSVLPKPPRLDHLCARFGEICVGLHLCWVRAELCGRPDTKRAETEEAALRRHSNSCWFTLGDRVVDKHTIHLLGSAGRNV